MIYKKLSSPFAQYSSLLKEYYHVETAKHLLKSVIEDFFVSIFLRSGSGLFTSVLKGLLFRFFVKSMYPLLIGKRLRLVHPSNIVMGHHIWLKDDVSVVANGPLKIGNDFVVGEGTTLWTDKKGMKIGNGVGIGKNCYLAQLGGSITIGDNVLVADNVRMYTLNHKFNDPKKLIIEQGYEEGTIRIEDNVWIGSGVIIFNSVTIGTGSIIGTQTVVTRDIPPYVLFAGIPGKVIKKLK